MLYRPNTAGNSYLQLSPNSKKSTINPRICRPFPPRSTRDRGMKSFMWALNTKHGPICVLLAFLSLIYTTVAETAQGESRPFSFLDDLHPLSTNIDCGENTALLQRTLQLELLMRTSKGLISDPNIGKTQLSSKLPQFDAFNKDIASHYSANDLSFDQSIDHIWFASCNHQNREQELWYNFFHKSQIDPQDPLHVDPGQLFLWLGDAIYMDRPPSPFNQHPADQRMDAVRQLWRENYCKAIRRQVPMNGMIDDHDFGLNNAGFDYQDKFRTKDLFFDFLDFPNPAELGASLRFTDIVYNSCGYAIGCFNNVGEISDECKDRVGTIVKDIHSLTIAQSVREGQNQQNQQNPSKPQPNTNTELNQKYPPDVINQCYIDYKSIGKYDRDDTSMYSTKRGFKHTSSLGGIDSSTDQFKTNYPIFNQTVNLSHIAPPPTRPLYESTLEDWYTDRRIRHGTYDFRLYGALFRRVKTILIDVRVGKIGGERMLLEPQWRWVEDEFNKSIIPSVGEVYFERIWGQKTTNNTNRPSVQKMVSFKHTIELIYNDYSTYNIQNGQITLNLDKIKQLKASSATMFESIQSGLQCKNPDFSIISVISHITQWNEGQYRHFGSDLILIGSGILVSSFGKLFSEGWREENLERTRLLSLTSHMMHYRRKIAMNGNCIWQLALCFVRKKCL